MPASCTYDEFVIYCEFVSLVSWIRERLYCDIKYRIHCTPQLRDARILHVCVNVSLWECVSSKDSMRGLFIYKEFVRWDRVSFWGSIGSLWDIGVQGVGEIAEWEFEIMNYLTNSLYPHSHGEFVRWFSVSSWKIVPTALRSSQCLHPVHVWKCEMSSWNNASACESEYVGELERECESEKLNSPRRHRHHRHRHHRHRHGTRFLCRWFSEWIVEWVGEWVSDWVSKWVNAWARVLEWVSAWVNQWASVIEWVGKWVGKWGNEWLDEWVCACVSEQEWLIERVSGWISEQRWWNEWVSEWMSEQECLNARVNNLMCEQVCVSVNESTHGGGRDLTLNIWTSRSIGFPDRSFEWLEIVQNIGDSRENVFDMYGDSCENLIKKNWQSWWL